MMVIGRRSRVYIEYYDVCVGGAVAGWAFIIFFF
ncbi:hypothetical protein AMBR_CKHPCMOK_02851 [Lacticaseibacillus rhamnosus]|nr:hypothetical protein AMBR_CKHPCMOK_02851 [Lacticaseibacillus rhamnosus]